MATLPVTYYTTECDGCGDLDNEGDYSAWSDAHAAVEHAIEEMNWRETEEGQLLCSICFEEYTAKLERKVDPDDEIEREPEILTLRAKGHPFKPDPAIDAWVSEHRHPVRP